METQFKQDRWDIIRKARRAALLRAAGEVFAQIGLDRANMRTIADACGVTKATVYAHFGNKEGLFEATVEDWLNALPVPSMPSSNDADLRTQLNHLAWEILQSTQHPASTSFAQMLSRTSSVPEPILKRWLQRHRVHRRYLEDVLSRCCDCENPALGASQFLLLVVDDHAHDGVLSEAASRAMAAVDLFVRAFSSHGPTSGASCPGEVAHA